MAKKKFELKLSPEEANFATGQAMRAAYHKWLREPLIGGDGKIHSAAQALQVVGTAFLKFVVFVFVTALKLFFFLLSLLPYFIMGYIAMGVYDDLTQR